jgi:hypothetical protein
MYAFFDGADFGKHYDRMPYCIGNFSELMDEFYLMNKNRTNPPATPGDLIYEGETWFILDTISTDYRETMLNCFAAGVQIHSYTKTFKKYFNTTEELLFVMMFNVLT